MDKELKEILKEENITYKAFKFAFYAHKNQFRKLGENIPYIEHPIKVARIISLCNEPYVDNDLIAAAYLHDVVEDTKFSIDEIEKHFGEKIMRYVDVMTEQDKTLTWEERKQETINKIKLLNEKEKLLMLADKLANIQDMNKYFRLNDKDFSKFNRGKDKQEWYYRNLYKELTNGHDENKVLFKLFSFNINSVFERSMSDYFNTENNKVLKKEFK